MPTDPRPRRDPTADWDQLRLLVASSEQEAYELLRPIVLFGQPIPARARETAVPERTLRRKVARFAAHGMRSLFDLDALAPPTASRRRLPPDIRCAIVALKAEYPPLSLREIATICRHRFDRPVSHHTVRAVLASEPLPLRPPRRFPRYHETADPVLHSPKAILLANSEVTAELGRNASQTALGLAHFGSLPPSSTGSMPTTGNSPAVSKARESQHVEARRVRT